MESYYFYTTLMLVLFELTGGIVYDEETTYIKNVLIAFIDQIVDDPNMGLRDAFHAFFYIFGKKGIQQPRILHEDCNSIKKLIEKSEGRQEVYQFLYRLGEIEKKISECRTKEEFLNFRLESNCEMMWNFCDWKDADTVYSISCIATITDDIIDLEEDEHLYINEENLDFHISKLKMCLEIFNQKMEYDCSDYIPLIVTAFKSLALYTWKEKGNSNRVFSGLRRFALSFIVLLLIQSVNSS